MLETRRTGIIVMGIITSAIGSFFLLCITAELTIGAPVVETQYGSVEGKHNLLEGTESFLGVPFGSPPIGSLRWQPPVPPANWTGVRRATSYGHNCATKQSSDYVKDVSEDCLYLNIFRPDSAKAGDKFPVLHYFYGGSWEYGGSSFLVYNGELLARHYNVIVVTSNYRLGPFGYLGSKELAAQSNDNSTGNYGTQDQILAMKFVKNNIANFGGNVDNIMIYGQSAGSGSIVNHLVQPESNGLFAVATMESGPPTDWSAVLMDDAQTHFEAVVAKANCTMDSAVDCLRTKTTEEIAASRSDSGSISWGPVVDGVFLQTDPQLAWQKGSFNDVKAVILGTNANEGTEFVKFPQDGTAEQLNASLVEMYGATMAAELEALYPVRNFDTPFHAASMIETDLGFACPARRGARWLENATIDRYLYHFVHQPFVLKEFEDYLLVGHSSEVPFVFQFWELLWGFGEVDLAKTMGSYWTNLARNSDPNNRTDSKGPTGRDHPDWPMYTAAQGSYMEFDIKSSIKTNLKDKVCDYWDSKFNLHCRLINCPCNCPPTL